MKARHLKQRQSLSLEHKIILSHRRIRKFYDYFNGNVYISFSGGKDSTVLLHIIRTIYPNIPAVFVNTGLEYPEIVEFVKNTPNVTWIRPEMNFKRVLEEYGYPVVSKEVAKCIHHLKNPTSRNFYSRRYMITGVRKDGTKADKCTHLLPKKWMFLVDSPFKISQLCCDVMKKKPVKRYERISKRKGYIGTMAMDSHMRATGYFKTGCNTYSGNHIKSRPLAFWTQEDIWEYIKKYDLPYSRIYDMGASNTGCMFCMFGVHREKGKNRFQRMKTQHPKLYDYCINKLGCGEVLDYIGVKY